MTTTVAIFVKPGNLDRCSCETEMQYATAKCDNMYNPQVSSLNGDWGSLTDHTVLSGKLEVTFHICSAIIDEKSNSAVQSCFALGKNLLLNIINGDTLFFILWHLSSLHFYTVANYLF